LDKVLKVTRDLLERLYAESLQPPPPLESLNESLNAGSLRVFSDADYGGIGLTGDTEAMYRECEESLIGLHPKNPDLRPLSRDATEKLLSGTVLRVLRPKDPPAARPTFEARAAEELEKLRQDLLAEPKPWKFWVPVHGFVLTSLPVTLGAVSFVEATEAEAGAIAAHVLDPDPGEPMDEEKRSGVIADHQRGRDSLVTGFSGAHAIASVEVLALDYAAAKHLGLRKVRRALDIINFFAPLFLRYSDEYRVSVEPDTRRKLPIMAAWPSQGAGFHSTLAWQRDLSVRMIDPLSAEGTKIGLARASVILASHHPTDLDERILTALSWAGRGIVEERPEQAFLHFAIALEALLTKATSRAGVTDRVRLRAAHLMGTTPASRKYAFELLSRLYRTRSAIVHAGDSTDLTESDLQALRYLVTVALIAMLTRPPFRDMRNANALEKWLDDRVFGDEPPKGTPS
jgi:hypothetical protein